MVTTHNKVATIQFDSYILTRGMMEHGFEYGFGVCQELRASFLQVIWIVFINQEVVMRDLDRHVITNPNILCTFNHVPLNIHLVEKTSKTCIGTRIEFLQLV